jgi:CHAD domain-containing protein
MSLAKPALGEVPLREPATNPKVKSSMRTPALAKRPFPRVRKSPGIKANDPMAEAGRKILRFHFAHMLSHEKGTRLGEDIEELHDMRVATRRMRAAFEVFGPFFKPKAAKKHLKGLRAIGRVLGRVRDLDVFMEKAGHYLETTPQSERPGLEPLLNAWQRERSIERDKVLAYLDSEGYWQFKQDFNDFVSTPGAGARPMSDNNPEPDLVRHVAPILVYTNLAIVRAYEKIIKNAVIEQLHALRIGFKRLRYTLEFFREVLGEQAGEVINNIKTLQDHLGDLNDANVACQILGEFIETWEERQVDLPLQERQNPEPIVAYLAAKHAERHNLMVTFPKAWAHFNRPDILKSIALAVSKLS